MITRFSHDVIKLTQEQAEAVLQLKLIDETFANDYFLMVKGYNDDWDNYTEVLPEELENVAEGMYDDHELWLTDIAGHERQKLSAEYEAQKKEGSNG